MDEQWFFSRNNEKYGPYSWKDLCAMAQKTKQLLPTDLVWSPMEQLWIQADQVQGLFSKVSSPKIPLIILGGILCFAILGAMTYMFWNSQPKTAYISSKSSNHQGSVPTQERTDSASSLEKKEDSQQAPAQVTTSAPRQEPFYMTIPSRATFNYPKEHHFLIAKYENESRTSSIIFGIDISNGKETIEHIVAEQSRNSLHCIDLSNNGKILALETSNGLITMDRSSKQVYMVDPYDPQDQQHRYLKKYFTQVKWSFDNRYLLYFVLAMEAHQIQIYDLHNKQKIIPEGKGYLSGNSIHWSPKENRYLDASYSDVYDNIPGLYLSKPKQVEIFENLGPLIGMPQHVFEQAVFCPEGRKIAFLSALPDLTGEYLGPSYWEEKKQLMIYDLQTKQLQQVEDMVNTLWISFSNDGSSLLYSKESGKEIHIYSFDLASQKKKHILILAGSNASVNIINILDSQWINNDQLVFVLEEKIDLNTPENSIIIVFDLEQQSLLHSSNQFDHHINLLSVNNQAI